MERLLALVLLVGTLYWTFRKARKRASASSGRRRFVLIASLVQLGAGLVIALWLPTRVRDTPGSPAALVMITLCWLIGGIMVVTALIGLLAAGLTRPE